MESLLEKLKSLGVTIGTENKDLKPIVRFPIDSIIRGNWLSDELGNVFMVSSTFNQDYKHGKSQFHLNLLFDKLLEVTGLQAESTIIKEILFIDTETTGLSGGTGTMAFMVGIGFFNESSFQVNQFFLDNPNDELAMLNQLSNLSDKFKVIVSYNGSSFDLPLMKSRFLLNRLQSPFSKMQHLDLLHLSRKLWKLRLQSCRLRDIETEILNFERAEEEVPSWMVPQIYFDYLFTGDARPLKGVFYHNCMDVLSLAVLFTYISDLLLKPQSKVEIHQLDLLSLAKLFEINGFFDESMILYQLSIDKGIPDHLEPEILLKYARLCRKMNQTETALELWELGSQKGNILSIIELAKYYEHTAKDYGTANLWAEKGLSLLDQDDISDIPLNKIKLDLQKRHLRLLKRILNSDY